MCPLRVSLAKSTGQPELENAFGTVLLREKLDTIIRIYSPELRTDRIRYFVVYGDLKKQVSKNKLSLPFPAGKKYKIIQGYNGKFSHKTVYSSFALDFNLQIGDTITAADDGFVVGLIQDYKDHGTSKQWRDNDKSNYITLYHPQSGLFTQYVHLNYKGALVKMGDFVSKKQPVGISGMTGYTTTPHLHFNVKVPAEKGGLVSTSIQFDDTAGISLTNTR
jgi:murein DD-endopeptidase MepM/ murein hydrolase activator NlpD